MAYVLILSEFLVLFPYHFLHYFPGDNFIYQGTEVIQGMVLHLSKSYEADWDTEAFSEMCNIRLLIILSDLHLPRGLKRLPSALKVLEWLGYPLKALPLGNLDKLVSLKMHSSKIKQLWNGIQVKSVML